MASSAVRPQVAWFPVLLLYRGVHQLKIGWRDSSGVHKLYSCDGKTVNKDRKISMGPICSVSYLVDKETSRKFRMKSVSGRKIDFSLDILDPTLGKLCGFTTLWLEMRAVGEEEKLAKFLNALVQSKPFTVSPAPQDYDTDGCKLTVVNTIEAHREEFSVFVAKAVEDSVEVESINDVMKHYEGVEGRGREGVATEKRKSVASSGGSTKLSRDEKREAERNKEIQAKDGLESETMASYKTREEISLDKLKLSPELQKENPVNPIRVDKLVQSMKATFDPSQMCLTVVPDPESPAADPDYLVISGQNRLSAMKVLDREGCLVLFPSCRKRTVMCVVLKSTSPSLLAYIAKRNGNIQADCQSPSAHELLFTLARLRETMTEDKAAETIKRMCVLLRVSGEDMTALQKLSTWPVQSLRDMSTMVRSYMNYKTLDVREQKRGFSINVKKGLPLPVQKSMFRNISRVGSHQVANLLANVMTNNISLKEGVDLCLKNQKRQRTLQIIGEIMQESTDVVMREHGQYFTDKILDDFSDACYGKNAAGELKYNERGEQLKKYCGEVTDQTVVEQTVVETVVEQTGPKQTVVESSSSNDDQFEEIVGKLLQEFTTIQVNSKP